MRYIEVGGEIDKNNQLILHELLDQIKPQRVEINIVFRDDDDNDVDVEREPTNKEIEERIEKYLLEQSRGEIRSIEQMWENIMIEATGEINDFGQLVLDEPLKKTEAQYVNIVVFFIKDEEYKKKFYESEENIYEEHLALIKKHSEPKVPSYAE
jgi:wyosine [tRNA(Phe)-imidazoG37] synthetase (radical SAM superfamily)